MEYMLPNQYNHFITDMNYKELLIGLVIVHIISQCNVRGQGMECNPQIRCNPGEFCVEVPGNNSDRCDPCPIGQYQSMVAHAVTNCTNCTTGNHYLTMWRHYVLIDCHGWEISDRFV